MAAAAGTVNERGAWRAPCARASGSVLATNSIVSAAHISVLLVAVALALALSGCSGRESAATREIARAGGAAVAGAQGAVDYVEFSGVETTDATLEQLAREMTNLPSLKRIQLRDTAVTGRGLAAFAGLKQVRVVDVQGSPIDDEGLATLGTLSELTSLNLARTAVTDAGLKGLSGLVKLRILDLSGTSVTDAAVSALAALPELRSLNLKGTKIAASGLSRLKRSKPDLSVAK